MNEKTIDEQEAESVEQEEGAAIEAEEQEAMDLPFDDEDDPGAASIQYVEGVSQIKTAGKIKDFALATRKMTIETYVTTEDLDILDQMVKHGWIVNITLTYAERQTTFIPPENEAEEGEQKDDLANGRDETEKDS